jgi:hypothetical protein
MFDPGTAQTTPPSTHSLAALPPCCHCEPGTVGEIVGVSVTSKLFTLSKLRRERGRSEPAAAAPTADPPWCLQPLQHLESFSQLPILLDEFLPLLLASIRCLPLALILRQFHQAPFWRPAGLSPGIWPFL